ncbi:MAG: porphobilinogen synthase, partial [Sandarakinorhabdus sp.]|nr:porphobilinogen synthase [Sandarakinorhabdus sp.]
MTRSYPATRLRRTRVAPWSRALHAENTLTPADLIWPIFVTEGRGVTDPIRTMPGVDRLSVDKLAAAAKQAVALGIPCIALFPNTQGHLRTED